MDEPLEWPDDKIVIEHHGGEKVTLLQAPAIATAGALTLDLAAAGYWPGVRIDEGDLVFDALNGRWRYRVDAVTLLAAALFERRNLTLVEGTPLVPSPQGAAQGGGALAGAVVAPADREPQGGDVAQEGAA